MGQSDCVHYWNYEHSVYQGRGPEVLGVYNPEIGVVRYCSRCHLKQMAFTSAWQKPPRQYDLSDVGKPPEPGP
jgi:hypothetical protein